MIVNDGPTAPEVVRRLPIGAEPGPSGVLQPEPAPWPALEGVA